MRNHSDDVVSAVNRVGSQMEADASSLLRADGLRYQLITEKKNHAEAAAYCSAIDGGGGGDSSGSGGSGGGGRLAMAKTLMSLAVLSEYRSRDGIWIGVVQGNPTGNEVFFLDDVSRSTPIPAPLLHWAAGQPATPSGGAGCVSIGADHKWSLKSCAEKKTFLCQTVA